MSIIAPAILSETSDDFKAYIDKIDGFAKRIHIDISDGKFAPNKTISPEQIWWPSGLIADIHAMVENPIDSLQKMIDLRPNLVIYHAEIKNDYFIEAVKELKKVGIKVGVALLRTTVPTDVSKLISMVDHVLIFSGDLGKYGGTANLIQLEKIRLIKTINPKVEIGWDGGVNLTNAFAIANDGVNVLDVGGAIAKADKPVDMYNQLVNEANRKGVF